MKKFHKCNYCGESYTKREIKRRYGEFSPVYYLGLCSAQCYTKRQAERTQS